MQALEYKTLKVGDLVSFQMNHWSTLNWHKVELLYVSKKYVIMYNIERQEEHCINLENRDMNTPVFTK